VTGFGEGGGGADYDGVRDEAHEGSELAGEGGEAVCWRRGRRRGVRVGAGFARWGDGPSALALGGGMEGSLVLVLAMEG
jgi:hypothetical protein